MNDEVRFVGHGVDLVDRYLQRGNNIWIGRLVKTDVAVADLYKAEIGSYASILAAALGECPRHRNAAAHGPDQACSRPCHALQEPATIDAVIVEVLQLFIDKILLFVRHLPSVVCSALS